MFFTIYQYWKKRKPQIKGWFFRIFCSSSRIKVGSNFQCDTFPEMLIDRNCKVNIGNNVLLRRNVEIRCHGKSTIEIENNVRIDRGVRLLAANNSKITIGDGTRIGLYTVFNGGDSITIGKKVLISGFVYLQTSMHKHQKNKDVQDQGYAHHPVELKDDAWLGAHVVVLPGCTIGKGAVVGSNAVVTQSVNDNMVVAGIPAKPLKERE